MRIYFIAQTLEQFIVIIGDVTSRKARRQVVSRIGTKNLPKQAIRWEAVRFNA
jgi:hypothetical protein